MNVLNNDARTVAAGYDTLSRVNALTFSQGRAVCLIDDVAV
jgi:hypothetical protein